MQWAAGVRQEGVFCTVEGLKCQVGAGELQNGFALGLGWGWEEAPQG